jgi:hypothetical protein
MSLLAKREGGRRSGLPREKSKTFDGPWVAFNLNPSSNKLRTMEAFWRALLL